MDLLDCCGQSYNNGANMIVKSKGVKSRLAEMNEKVLFVPCYTHILNLFCRIDSTDDS